MHKRQTNERRAIMQSSSTTYSADDGRRTVWMSLLKLLLLVRTLAIIKYVPSTVLCNKKKKDRLANISEINLHQDNMIDIQNNNLASHTRRQERAVESIAKDVFIPLRILVQYYSSTQG